MCLSQEPDGRERDRETLKKEGRGEDRVGKLETGTEMGIKKETSNYHREGDVESGEAPATLLSVDDDELL